jgi:signal transduction histidine kinase
MSFLTVFVRSPGDVIYFALMAGVLLACLFMVIGQHIRAHTVVTGRLLRGIGGALTGWWVLLMASLISVFVPSVVPVLMVLERAVALVMIMMLGWAFALDEQTQLSLRGFWVAVLGSALAIAAAILTGIAGGDGSATGGTADLLWGLAPLALLILTTVVFARRWRAILDAPLKAVWSGVLLAGNTLAVLQLWQGEPILQLGAGRLALVTSTAVACAVIYRAMVQQMQGAAEAAVSAVQGNGMPGLRAMESPAPAPRSVPRQLTAGERDSVQLLRALGLIIEETAPRQIPQQIVRATAEMLRADIGALIRFQDVNYADVTYAYDRGRGKVLPGVSINLENQPTLRNAIERGQQRPLLPDRNESELQDLYPRLTVETIGPAYLQPLTRSGKVIAVLLIAFPFTGRELNESEIESLRGIGVMAGSLLALSDEAEEARQMAEERAIQAMAKGLPLSQITDQQVMTDRRNAYLELQFARTEISQLNGQLRALEQRLAYERNRLVRVLGDSEEDLSLSQRIMAINEEQLTLRQERAQMQSRLQQLESVLMTVTEASDHKMIVAALTSLRRERDELEAQRDRLQAQVEAMSRGMYGREAVQVTVSEMGEERSALQVERDQLRARLGEMEDELRQLGVDVTDDGIAQVIGKLMQERHDLQVKVAEFEHERESWSRKVAQLNQRLAGVRDAETRLSELQRQVQNLAVDREMATLQLDKMRKQRDELALRVQKFNDYRERMNATIEGLRSELEAARQSVGGDAGAVTGRANNPLVMELSRSMGRITELERELKAARARVGRSTDQPRAVGQQQIDAMIELAQELRSPLTSITGYLDLLLKESVGILGDMQRRFVQRVIANAQRLAGMVDDMVRLAAFDAGRVNLTLEPTDVVAVVEAAITELSVGLREKGIEVDLSVDDGVPLVLGDKDALKQMVGQVMTNAYLASPNDGVIRVGVMAQHSPAGVRIRVEDSGEGVPPEAEEQVFARRYQAENPLLPGLGDTGVAMAVAKALVEAHQGQIWLERPAAGGTAVVVHLPAVG